MTRRLLHSLPALLAGLLGLLFVGTALSPSPAVATAVAPRSVSLTLMSYLPTLGPGPAGILDGLVKSFESAHPGVQVKVESTSSGTAQGITSSIQQQVAAGTPPDIAQDSFDGLRFAISGLGAQPLDRVEGKAAVSQAFGGDHPYVSAVTKLGKIAGHTYAIPWTLSTPVLFYDQTLFQQAGITEPPKDWAEVTSDAALLKQKTGADALANGCVGAGTPGDWCLQSMVLSGGGAILNGNKIAWGNAASVAALKTLQGVADAGGLSNLTGAQAISEFGAGKLAMYLQTSAVQSTLLSAAGGRFQVAAAAEPGFGNKPAVPTNSGSGLVMLTKDKAKQKAAWQLMAWLTNDAAQTTITENIGYPPLRPTLTDDARYLKSWSHAQALLPVNLAQLARVRPTQAYPGPNFLQIETLFIDAATKVVFQNGDPKQTMQQAQSQAQTLVQGS